MQTVDLKYNVPVGYSLEEFVAKVNAYVARLAKKSQSKQEVCDYEPNEETIEAIKEGMAHIAAIKDGTVDPNEGVIDTSSVEAMLKSCGL